MALDLTALQDKVREVASGASFVHCDVHHLNIVLSQGVKFIPQTKVLFAMLGDFTSFFDSARYWPCLRNLVVLKCLRILQHVEISYSGC